MSAPDRRMLVITPDFPPAVGGIQHLTARLVEHLDRWRTRVVTFDDLGAARYDAGCEAEVIRVRRTGVPKLANGVLNAAAVLAAARRRPDVVLNIHVITAPATATIAAALRLPVVQYLHANELAMRPRLTRRALRAAERSIAVSEHTRRLAVSLGVAAERVTVIPPGVDPSPKTAGRRAAEPTVITVARLTQPYKGHALMAEAIAHVRERIADVRWLVVGDGPLRESVEATVARFGLGDAVRFTGEVSDRERDALLATAHVFAMPSRLPPGGEGGEGFGIVYMEAATRGLPVVAGNVGGALDAVVDGETGLLVDPSDARAVGGAIAQLLADPERANRLGEAGRERAREFSWPLIADRVDRVLEAVIAGRRRRR